MINYLLRCIKRQFSISHLWKLVKMFLAFLGTYYSILKILLLIRDAYKDNKNCAEFCDFIDQISGEWVIWELLIILLLVIILGWKKIKTSYTLKNGLKIVFDYCSVLKQSGDIVIEVPNSYTTNPKEIETDTFYGKFLGEYHRINKSEALLQIIKKDLSSKGFKPDKIINAHKDQERYELGSFCEIGFNGKTYLLAASYKTNTKNGIISNSIDDYNIFLCNLWANLSRIGANRKVLDIPIFGNQSLPYLDTITTEKKIYQILKTYIFNSKKNSLCAKELHMCFFEDKENEKDLEKYVTIAKFLDEFRTEEREDKEPQGTGLD